jgi:hypothetical protein
MMTLDTTQVLQLPEAERRARLRELLGVAAPPAAAGAPTGIERNDPAAAAPGNAAPALPTGVTMTPTP